MKTLHFLVLGAGLLAIGGSTLHSQSDAPPRGVQQTLLEMKARNQKLIDQQTATLQKLEELEKSASQLRLFAKRA